MNIVKLFYKDGLYAKPICNISKLTYTDRNYANQVKHYVESGYFQVVLRKKDFYEVISKLLCKYDFVDVDVVLTSNVVYGQSIPCSYSMFIDNSNIHLVKSLGDNYMISRISFIDNYDNYDSYVIYNNGVVCCGSSGEALGYVVDIIEDVVGDLYDSL